MVTKAMPGTIVLRKGADGIAFVDPRKAYGQPGQYKAYRGPQFHDLDDGQRMAMIAAAMARGDEVRLYYREINQSEFPGLIINSEHSDVLFRPLLIVTYIPPGHVQPFHLHEKLIELTLVNKGKLIAISSDSLMEEDFHLLVAEGKMLSEGDVVVEPPGSRHTILNPESAYTFITTIQIPVEGYLADPGTYQNDWSRGAASMTAPESIEVKK